MKGKSIPSFGMMVSSNQPAMTETWKHEFLNYGESSMLILSHGTEMLWSRLLFSTRPMTGLKINRLAVGPGVHGLFWSRGWRCDQEMEWKALCPCQRPLYCHHAAVRVLNFGSNNALVSGDDNGDVSIWKVQRAFCFLCILCALFFFSFSQFDHVC